MNNSAELSKKPAVFVGSSSEGLEFARAVRGCLLTDAEITVWDEGVFNAGETILQALINSLDKFHCAILVLTKDDFIKSRSDEIFGPRDNVVFEAGLFMGRLGPKQTFLIHESRVKIPSDLSGLITARFDWPRPDGNYRAAVGHACDLIRPSIKRAISIRDLVVLAQEQVKQAQEIDWIKKTIDLFLSQWERTHLRALASDEPFVADVDSNSSFEWELRHLLTIGLIDRRPGKGIRKLFAIKDRVDVKEHLYVTDRGKAYLKMYDESVSKD